MFPSTRHIFAVTLVLVMCHAGAKEGRTTVVREGHSASGNPAVEAGGHHLPPGPPPAIPYSFIGAMETENQWCAPIAAWPWRMFGSFASHFHFGRGLQFGARLHFGARRNHAASFRTLPAGLPPLP
jgi:hypothetical protein